MKKVLLYSESLCKHYTAPRWSIAYIFSILCTALTFVIPFYMCFSPRYALNLNPQSPSGIRDRSTIATPVGIWLKHDTYREQPKVRFQYKVIFVAQLKEKTKDNNSISKEVYYSTIDDLNDLRLETFRSASTTSREADDDFDGVMDRLLVNIKMPLKANEYVYSIQALAFVKYRLDTHVKMEMESLIYVQHESALPGSKFTTIGDLCLRQLTPIPIIGMSPDGANSENIWTLFSDNRLIDFQSVGKVASQSNIGNIIHKYQSRSIATDYNERFPMWTRQVEDAYVVDDMNEEGLDKHIKDFEFDLTVTIPKMQSVVYVPTLGEVLTEAWVRYLSQLVITGLIIQRMLSFVLRNHIFKANVSIR